MYELGFADKKAQKEFEKACKSGHKDLLKKLKDVLISPKTRGKRLAGELHGLWKIKAPPFRVIYKIDEEEQMVILIRIDNRDDVYDLDGLIEE